MIPSQFAPLAIRLGLSHRDTIEARTIEQLVADGVTEDDSIDFKRTMYAVKEDQAKDELAKDVAAFANHRGGVLIIGVEDVNGRASGALPFAGGDATKRQVLSVHAARVRPLVPDLAVEWIAASPYAEGYLLIGVPASPLAPHAAGNPNQGALRFPVRTGSQSRYMSEAELAAKYMQRMSTVATSTARAATLSNEAEAWLGRNEPWIHLTVVPHAPGSMRIGVGTRNAVQNWIARLAPTDVWGTGHMEQPDCEIGHRRVSVGMWSPQGAVTNYYADLYSDGAAFVARQCGELTRLPGTEGEVHFIALTELVNACALALRFAVMHAVDNTGATGTAHVNVGVLPADHPAPMVIGPWRPRRVAPRSRHIQTVPPMDHVLSLDAVALDGAEWMRLTKTIADEVVQCFGLDEVPQLTADGEIRTGWWGVGDDLKAFAARYGIPIAQG